MCCMDILGNINIKKRWVGGGGTGNDSRLGWLYFYFVEVKL